MTRPAAPSLVIGVGARRGVLAREILDVVRVAMDAAGADPADVRSLSTSDGKAAEPGIRAAADLLGVDLLGHSADTLAAIDVPNPSEIARAVVGVPSVAEAAALAGAGSGARLLVEKVATDTATAAVASAVDLRHHGDTEATAGLVDLAVNVHGTAPPSWLRTAIAASLDGLARYPDTQAACAALAARHDRDIDEVLPTAGAAEAFTLIARSRRWRHPVVVHPQFTEPEAALRAAGHTVDRLVLGAAGGFTLDAAAVPEDADLVILGNPTNPTSVLHPAGVVRALRRPGRVVVVDEAFMDAVPGEPETLAGVRESGLVVVRSLTKTWALAGLRVGYLVGDATVLRACAAQAPPWSVSVPALAAMVVTATGAAAAECARIAEQIGAERGHLLARLAPLPVEVAGSPAGPFVLVRVRDGLGVRDTLRGRGFAIRRGDTFPGLGPDWLRIAVRPPSVIDGFVAALQGILAPLPAMPDRAPRRR